MGSGPGDTDTGEEGVAPRAPEDSWRIGAGIEPDDAVEGAAALQEAEDAGSAAPTGERDGG